jgi:outer membrane protein TolC
MSRARSPRFTALCAALLLLPAGCTVSMKHLLEDGPPVPGPLSSGVSPPLDVLDGGWAEQIPTSGSKVSVFSPIVRTAYREADASPATLPAGLVLSLDTVLRLTCERNARILLARERVNEQQAAYDAAVNSCVPEFLRKDTFKRPFAEAELWRRRAELQKAQNEALQDAASTYFDWLTAQRGEAISRDLERYFEKLLKRAQKLVDSGEKPAQVIVEAIQTGLDGLRQSILHTHQQAAAAAAKLSYLMGNGDGLLVPSQALGPVDFVDASSPLAAMVRQAQDNGPGVRELLGLAAAIQQGINDAHCAQRICNRTGAALVCGRLRMAQSELQQSQLALVDLQGKLRAGIEEAITAIHSGREQITLASTAIKHAAETYRITNLRLESEGAVDSMRNNTYNAVLNSIRQLSQAHTNYLTAVNAYNKAEARLLLLIGTYNDCKPRGH